MLKKTIEYEDFNGNTREEDFYFHLSEPELIEMEMGTAGGLVQMINKIISAQDNEKIVSIFKMLILKAYGEKSDDGRRFIKSDELSTNFSHTAAYSKLFIELASNAEEAAKFVNGIIPRELQLEDKKVPLDFQKKKDNYIVEQQNSNE